MKKLIIIMLAAIIPSVIWAQATPLSSLYDRYVSEPGFETSEIMPGSASFEWEQSLDNSTIKEMMQSIESIRIVKSKDGAGDKNRDKAWKKMQKAVSEGSYTEIMSVNADDAYVRMYMIKGSVGKTREVALLAKGDHGLMMITMTGDMDFSAMFSPESMHSMREMGEYFIKQKGGCEHPQ